MSARTLSLLDQALALQPHERGAFLDAQCAGDPALRAELDALLYADAESEGFLEPIQAKDADRAGERVGAYRLVRELGAGGMGRVFLAERADALYEKRVAVKFLRYDFGDLRSRFANERRILAALDHPNIAKLIDAGADAHGAPFVVMEYVEGEAITVYAEKRALPLRARVELFLAVLDAVQAAHARLVVHRDLKPSNILVGADGKPSLLDFGIAKLVDAPARELTLTGAAPMTPEYASPEQVRGEPVSTASDVYALGVLLYELASGGRPYEIATLTPAEIERVVCETAPRRPRVDDELDHVVLKALAKSPAERYGSCVEFADDLRRWRDGQPVLAVHAGLAYRARKFVARHRLGVAAAAAIALAILAAAAVAIAQAQEARRQAIHARAERDRAERVTAFLTAMLGAADPAEGGRKVTVAELLDAAARDVETELSGDPATAAAVQATLAQTYRSLGLLDEALRLAREGYGLPTDRSTHANAALALGQVLLDRGDYPASGAKLEEARAALAADPAQRGELARAELLLGQWASQQQRFDDADAHFKRARAALEGSGAPEPRRLAELDDAMAVTRGRAGDLAGAEALHVRALETLRAARGAENPQTARVLFNLANVREMRDDFAGAETAYLEAARIQRAALGAKHPDLVQTLASNTFMLNRAGRYDEAVARGREAHAAAQALPRPHPIRAYAAAMLGEALLNAGDAAAAVEPLRDAAEQRATMLAADHPLKLNSESLLGAALAASGKREEGLAKMRAALERLEATLGPDHEFTKRAQTRLEKGLRAEG